MLEMASAEGQYVTSHCIICRAHTALEWSLDDGVWMKKARTDENDERMMIMMMATKTTTEEEDDDDEDDESHVERRVGLWTPKALKSIDNQIN